MAIGENGLKSKEELVVLIAQGDLTAEKAFFEHYGIIDRIELIVHARVKGEAQDRKDLIGEILTALLIKLRNGIFDREKGNVDDYVLGIARNKIREYFRRKKRSAVEIKLENDFESKVESHEVQFEQREYFATITRKLASKYQKVIYLRYYREESVERIAQRLGISVKQVYNRINYALKLLRQKY